MQTLWRRLWQPRQPLFWLFVAFNLMSSLCAWALRSLPLSAGGNVLVGLVALVNAGFGMLAAWRLVSDKSTARAPKNNGLDEASKPLT